MQEMTKDEQIAVMQAKIDEMTSAIAHSPGNGAIFDSAHQTTNYIRKQKQSPKRAYFWRWGLQYMTIWFIMATNKKQKDNM